MASEQGKQALGDDSRAVVSDKRKTAWGQKLLTAVERRNLPPLGAQDGAYKEAVAYAKFFGAGRFTFYATEYDGTDTFFGYILSPLGANCDEFCYMTATELLAMRFQFGSPVERDIHFTPATVASLIENLYGAQA